MTDTAAALARWHEVVAARDPGGREVHGAGLLRMLGG